VGIRVVVTEKHAGFSLPLRSNRANYRAFNGDADPKFYKWCKDLYLYYWEKAKPVTPKFA
jgi:predicted transcriptional regulator